MTRRVDFRVAHLELAWRASERGELLLGGTVGEPVESAVLLFRCDSPAIPTAFAQADPYVVNGLVTNWRVEPWNTIVGDEAANPLHPDHNAR
ncbi:YciI-like protein [Modicisalibacter muralis]|uniref:YciI-like protein n=1 Tax=Modicisalibacter muralis TaxID=119000 RepID=UPI00248203C1|nr:YciI-like protein [Halomonas muralis]